MSLRILRAVTAGNPQDTISITLRCYGEKRVSPWRGTVHLPHPVSQRMMAVIAPPALHPQLVSAGADYVFSGDNLSQITAIKPLHGVLCHPTLLPLLAKQAARYLGPRNLMPSAKQGTVTADLQQALSTAKSSVVYRTDKQYAVRIPVARIGWQEAEIEENVRQALRKVEEQAMEQWIRATGKVRKGGVLQAVHLNTTHSLALPYPLP